MNSIELDLLDLLDLAESPCYSAFCWLRRRLGGHLSLRAFLTLTNDLVQRDVIRMWSIDPGSGDRTELFAVPDSLADEYLAFQTLDDRYDPFGLSVTVGPAAPVLAQDEPEWTFSLDAAQETFVLRAQPEMRAEACATIARLLPDLVLDATEEMEDAVAGIVRDRRGPRL